MTLLKQEKSSEKMSLGKQINDAQQSLNKKEKELVAIQEELQQVYSVWIQYLVAFSLGFIEGQVQGKLNMCEPGCYLCLG